MKNKNYIRFEVSTFALPLVICSLYRNEVKNFSITQEDNSLIISIDADYLENICYGSKVNDIECNAVNDDK